MIKLKLGELALFGYDRFERFDFDKRITDAYLTGPVMGGTRHLTIRAKPKAPVPDGIKLEIMLYKIAGGRAQFVYSDVREAHRPQDEPTLIQLDFFLQHAPWGAGTYQIKLVSGRMVVAAGNIRFS